LELDEVIEDGITDACRKVWELTPEGIDLPFFEDLTGWEHHLIVPVDGMEQAHPWFELVDVKDNWHVGTQVRSFCHLAAGLV
jgi:hypothetical protein